MLVKLAKEHGLKLRQGNPKVGKRMKYQRLRMPSSSSARVARCDPSRHIWAASSATSIAKSDHRRRYRAPFDRSSMTRWRQRMGDARLEVLLQESLAMAVKTDAIEAKDLSKVIVDTTVQEKAITFPTDAKLLDRARTMLVKLAKKHGFELRQGIRAISDASGSLTIRLR